MGLKTPSKVGYAVHPKEKVSFRPPPLSTSHPHLTFTLLVGVGFSWSIPIRLVRCRVPVPIGWLKLTVRQINEGFVLLHQRSEEGGRRGRRLIRLRQLSEKSGHFRTRLQFMWFNDIGEVDRDDGRVAHRRRAAVGDPDVEGKARDGLKVQLSAVGHG